MTVLTIAVIQSYTALMPRPFTDSERDAIRRRLHVAGRDLFARRGLRATTVEALARAAGISKGAFYLFYPSKEALFLALMEEIEVQIQARLEAEVAEAPREAVRLLLRGSLTAQDDHPLLDLAMSDEAVAVMRSMSSEDQKAFLNRDIELTARIAGRMAEAGLRLTVDPAVLAGVLRALVFIGMHRNDIGAELMPAVQDVLVEGLARTLVEDGGTSGHEAEARDPDGRDAGTRTPDGRAARRTGTGRGGKAAGA